MEQTTAGTSIRERMAMLQLDQVARNSPPPPAAAPKPPPPPPPTQKPRLPPRTVPPPPPAPPRLPRRMASRESVISVASTSSNNSFGSNTTTRSLPPVYTGKASLPVQFPEKKEVVPVKRVHSLPPPPPRVVPPLPVREKGSEAVVVVERPPLPGRSRTVPVKRDVVELPRRLPPRMAGAPVVARDAGPPPIPRASRPPPVPVASRPSLSASPLPCLLCYDFAAPDAHAALPLFHRTRVASLPALAAALTAPFPTPLEKARAIFVWLHHNISYDTAAFFAGAIPPQAPTALLHSGLAVCAGYADLFTSLATHAGLTAVTVSGHGKGYGHIESDSATFSSNHAWNAVLLAPGTWHLIDPCWGSGHVAGPPSVSYTPRLAAECFVSPPSVFGRKHFPTDPALQHREDGRVLSWEEYSAPEVKGPKYYGVFTEQFAFSKEMVVPACKELVVGRRQRFRVALGCAHVQPVRAEEEYVLFLNVGGEFEEGNWVVLEGDGTGRGWEAEVVVREGGVQLYYVRVWEGRDAKGVGAERWKGGVGRVAWGWCPVVEWG